MILPSFNPTSVLLDVKRPGTESGRLASYNAEIKNMRIFLTVIHLHLHSHKSLYIVFPHVGPVRISLIERNIVKLCHFACLLSLTFIPSLTSPAEHLNPLNPELNPICYLLALLGAHHFLHVSRIRVKLLTFRR